MDSSTPMPSARQPNPHRRRRDDRLPWFGGLLALFWMLASPWLRADVCEVRVGIDATGRADAVAWTDRIVAGLSAPSFRFVNRKNEIIFSLDGTGGCGSCWQAARDRIATKKARQLD